MKIKNFLSLVLATCIMGLAASYAVATITPTIIGVTQPAATVNAIGNSSTAFTVNFALGYGQTVTMTGNATMTCTNIPPSGSIVYIQITTAANTLSWCSQAKGFAPGATMPVPTQASGKVETYTFVSDGTNLRLISDSAAPNYYQTVSTGGTLPTVTTCGTGSVTAGATNMAGQVAATGATACTLVFDTTNPFTNAPICVATDYTTAAGLKIVNNTTVSITVSGLTSGDTFDYVCIGK